LASNLAGQGLERASLNLPSTSAGNGQFLSLEYQEDRVANDRSQGTAGVARSLRAATKSLKRALMAL
jgi:hypothetical protein